MNAAHYAPRSIEFYVRELRFLFEYYPEVLPDDIVDTHITQYMCYVKDVLQCGRDKCRGVAQAFSFVWKHVFKRPFILPSKLYPRRNFRLPEVMSPEEVAKLISTPESLKSKTIIAFFYVTGLRVNEATYVKLCDIDRAGMRIKVTHGKGSKERYALLSPVLLKQLEDYYHQYHPEDYLFNGSKKGSRMGNRAMQLLMQNAVKKAGLNSAFIHCAIVLPLICWKQAVTSMPLKSCWAIASFKLRWCIYISPPMCVNKSFPRLTG